MSHPEGLPQNDDGNERREEIKPVPPDQEKPTSEDGIISSISEKSAEQAEKDRAKIELVRADLKKDTKSDFVSASILGSFSKITESFLKELGNLQGIERILKVHEYIRDLESTEKFVKPTDKEWWDKYIVKTLQTSGYTFDQLRQELVASNLSTEDLERLRIESIEREEVAKNKQEKKVGRRIRNGIDNALDWFDNLMNRFR
jgi:hypothetical protein